MTHEIQKKLEDWRWIQSLAFDVLETLNDYQLELTVGKHMGTVGEQFRHMIRVRFQYAEAIETHVLADAKERIDASVATSCNQLIELWKKANQALTSAVMSQDLDRADDVQIDWSHWGGESMNIHDHLNFLMDHETLHNGQLIVYLKTLEIPFPASWKAWGL